MEKNECVWNYEEFIWKKYGKVKNLHGNVKDS